MRARNPFRFIAALQAFLLLATLFLPALTAAAVWTDQADYSPGSVVTISGDNSDGAAYLRGETVDVVVTGPNGYAASCSAVADDAGAWSCQVTLWDTELAVGDYSYTATGQTSGVTETGTFSDSSHLTGVDNLSAFEGNADHDVQVNVAINGSGLLTVYWRTQATGNATAGTSCGGTADYVTTSGSTSTTGADFPVTVTICGDTTAETDETFQLEASTSSTFASGNEFGTVTISNDDNSASIADVSQAEGNGPGTAPMVFTVTLDNPVSIGGTIQIDYATAGIGSTSSGVNCSASRDFISANGTLTFIAGETSHPISVPICGDTTAEADETFAVNLSANTTTNTAVIIGDAQAIGTILDDDTPASNTPPGVAVTGVTNGSSYDKGSVPAAGCSVVDAEDGNSSFAATLSVVTGPDAAFGIGSQTASCMYTDGGGLSGSASATYTISDGTAPSITYVLTPSSPDGSNGWFRGPVTLDWTVTEGDSPSTLVLTDCVDQDLTADQASTDYSCSAASSGGSAGPVSVSIKIDGTVPTISISHTPDGANGWNVTDPVAEMIDASDATSGIDSVDCTDDASGIGSVAGTEPTYSAGVGGDGVHNLSCTATDAAGNVSGADTDQVKIDTVAPTISISHIPDGANGWNVTDPVAEMIDASDATSGIDSVDCTDDASGIGSVAGTEPTYSAGVGGDGVHNLSCTATDAAGNVSGADTDQVKIDTVAPTISITTPPNGAVYLLNQAVSADYGCIDATSGIDSCVGDVANGAAIDTASVGSRSFTVTATDQAGNAAAATNTYDVKYNVCVLYDQTKAHKAGSTVPIKLYVCDVNGLNVSDSNLVVMATYLSKSDGTSSASVEDAGNSNPDNNFRFDSSLYPGGGYIFNLSSKSPSPALGQTTSLSKGTWKMYFKIGTSTGYFVTFDIK